jgi:dihydroflavonol-4-reductase
MILVTGATGLLGSNLLIELSKSNDEIIALYQTKSKIHKVKLLFQFYFKDDLNNYEFFFNKIVWNKCDILDIYSLEKYIKQCDFVYHCAALVSFRRRDFSLMMKINTQGTANVVNLCLQYNVKKLCYVSSTSAVGKTLENGVNYVKESNKWTQNAKTSGYSISKYSAEKEVWRGIEEGLNAVIINPSVIFGPASWDESSMTIFKTFQNGFPFYTNGTNAFVDVRDVVKCMIVLMSSKIAGQRFLCTGNNTSFKDLFHSLAVFFNKKPPHLYASKFLCEIAWRLASLIAVFSKKSTITKESVESAQDKVVYDSSKLIDELNFEFIKLDETIDFCIKGKLI